MKKILSIMVLAFGAASCGSEPNTGDPTPFNPNLGDMQMHNNNNDPKGKVTRCLGPSCPRGECGFSGDCSAYEGFDALDNSAVCASATGAKELCLKYEVPRADGYVDIFEQAISCAQATVVKRSCSAGCGYNYAPDDCAVCNESNGCAFNN